MPQTFRVLQCHSCKTFQVQQVKKSNKWTCKLCNEKQSVIKVYDQGSAVDCRKQVQRLNMMRKEKDDTNTIATCSMQPPEGYSDVYATESGDDSPPMEKQRPAAIVSGKNGRWALFADPKESESDQEEADEGGDTFTTSRAEFEQICLKLRKDKSRVRSAQHRLTGFHPVSKRLAGTDHNDESPLKSPSTHSLPSNLAQDTNSLFPYSSVGESLNSMLNEQVTRTTSLRRLHGNDRHGNDVHGSYRKFDMEKEEEKEEEKIARPRIRHDVESKTVSSGSSEVSSRVSKWSRFMPQNVSEEEISD